ncbi:MAG TPA: DUF418 domain-containing protein [Holophagaceae bacterium]|nr:DUF418 domain-containing protein [Holophagaceae bacterium]
MTHHTPVGGAERLDSVDLVRGYALLGVLLMNVHLWLRNPPQPYWLDPHPWPGALNHATDVLLRFWFETKSVTLFSALFALGLCIQRERALEKGLHWGVYAGRRMGSMLLFGLLHIVLIWNGDILSWYAVCSLTILPFLGRKEATLRRWILGVAGLQVVSILVFGVFKMFGPPPTAQALLASPGGRAEEIRAWGQACVQGYQQTSWIAVMRFRLADYVKIYMSPLAVAIVSFIFLNFLVGTWIWKEGSLRAPREHAGRIGRFALVLLAIGGFLGIFLTFPEAILAFIRQHWRWARVGLPLLGLAQSLGAQPLGFGIGAGLVWLNLRPRWSVLLRPLTYVGRMAFTNYIVQSLVCTFVFYGWGLGLYNRVGPAAGMAFSFALFGLQVPFSRWWLSRFRFGPLEWLWRCLTYGELQPFRLGGPAGPA